MSVVINLSCSKSDSIDHSVSIVKDISISNQSQYLSRGTIWYYTWSEGFTTTTTVLQVRFPLSRTFLDYYPSVVLGLVDCFNQ